MLLLGGLMMHMLPDSVYCGEDSCKEFGPEANRRWNKVRYIHCFKPIWFALSLLADKILSFLAAYLSAAVQPSVKVEYTATLSTCAVLGFVMGPSIGALFCQVDTAVYDLPINANNAPGFLILVATFIMFVQVSMYFVLFTIALDLLRLMTLNVANNFNYRLYYSLMAKMTLQTYLVCTTKRGNTSKKVVLLQKEATRSFHSTLVEFL